MKFAPISRSSVAEEEDEALGMEEEEKKEENEGADLPLRNFPHWSAARRKFAPDCCFFSAGNLERELQAKQVKILPLTCTLPSVV